MAVGVSHCGAGCTLGDIIAEFTIFGLGITVAGRALWAEYLGDYVLAIALGLVFQYFAIAPMRGLGRKDGLIAAAKADIVSLTASDRLPGQRLADSARHQGGDVGRASAGDQPVDTCSNVMSCCGVNRHAVTPTMAPLVRSMLTMLT